MDEVLVEVVVEGVGPPAEEDEVEAEKVEEEAAVADGRFTAQFQNSRQYVLHWSILFHRGGGGRGGRGGRGSGRGGGRGGRGGGMKGGSKVVVEPHRHEGIFVARGKEDALVTLNSTPGVAVYGEKRITVEVPPTNGDSTPQKVEYRVWNPFRSKCT